MNVCESMNSGWQNNNYNTVSKGGGGDECECDNVGSNQANDLIFQNKIRNIGLFLRLEMHLGLWNDISKHKKECRKPTSLGSAFSPKKEPFNGPRSPFLETYLIIFQQIRLVLSAIVPTYLPRKWHVTHSVCSGSMKRRNSQIADWKFRNLPARSRFGEGRSAFRIRIRQLFCG